jgi:hypothetical protein
MLGSAASDFPCSYFWQPVVGNDTQLQIPKGIQNKVEMDTRSYTNITEGKMNHAER